jgi:hypothetical protein
MEQGYFLPKFIEHLTDIHAVIALKCIQDKYYFVCFSIITGECEVINYEFSTICAYTHEYVVIPSSAGGGIIYYDKMSLRAHREDGPAYINDNVIGFYYYGRKISSAEEFFEILEPEKKTKALYNLDLFK